MDQDKGQPKNKPLKHEIVGIRIKAVDEMWLFDSPPLREIQIQDSIATIPIYGILRNRNDYGGIDYTWIQSQLAKTIANQAITQINLEIDSPGGEVLGISELTEFIYASRKAKPIIAIVKNMACSAAYWIAAACSKIVLAGETTITGSIGVLAIHCDYSAVDKEYGRKITEIVSGKYKNITSPNVPLSADGQAYLQDQVDTFYSLFVQSIAKYRSKDIAKITAVADGREYIGSQAIGLGLADEIQTTIQGGSSMPTPEEMMQEIEKLKKEIEELKKQKEQSAPDQNAQCSPDEEKNKQAMVNVIKKAQADERNRMLALAALDHGGRSHDIVVQAQADGSTPEQAAYKILTDQNFLHQMTTQNFRDAMRDESKPIASTSNIPTTDSDRNALIKAMVQGADSYKGS